jgi:hypothetical protein
MPAGYCAGCGEDFSSGEAHRSHDDIVHGGSRTTFVPAIIMNPEKLDEIRASWNGRNSPYFRRPPRSIRRLLLRQASNRDLRDAERLAQEGYPDEVSKEELNEIVDEMDRRRRRRVLRS